MSPIFIRPVREQLEHDRLIRHLQAHYRKKNNEVAINPGEDQAMSVKLGPSLFFPDLVVSEGGRLTGLVEVESGESVNNLEAMAQWVHFGKARVPFHLYVPVQFYDSAKRLADTRGVRITEIWTYRGLLDGFDLVRMHHDPAAGVPKPGVPGVKVMGRPVPVPVTPAEVAAPEVVPPPPAAAARVPAGKAAAPAAPAGKPAAAPPRSTPTGRAEAVVPPKTSAKAAKAAPAPAKGVKPVAKAPAPVKPSKTAKPAKPAPRPVAKTSARNHKPKATAKPAAKRPKPTPKGAKKAARRK